MMDNSLPEGARYASPIIDGRSDPMMVVCKMILPEYGKKIELRKNYAGINDVLR